MNLALFYTWEDVRVYFCFIDYAKAFNSVDHNKLWKILRDGNIRPPYLPPEKPEKPVSRSRSNSYNHTWNNGLVQNWERSTSRLYIVLLIYLIRRVKFHIMWNAGLDEAQAWFPESRLPGEISIISYMQMTSPYGRKWRETKEPLDEGEGGRWKIWLKTQHSVNKDHGNQSHHFMGNKWGINGNSDRLYFLRSHNHCRWWLQPWN